MTVCRAYKLNKTTNMLTKHEPLTDDQWEQIKHFLKMTTLTCIVFETFGMECAT